MSLSDSPFGVSGGQARAWRLGFVAGREGMSRDANPYSVRSSGYRRVWEFGWVAGLTEFRLAKVEVRE